MINIALVINPNSGKGRGLKFLKEFDKVRIPPFIKLDKYITNFPNHASEISREISTIMSDKYDRILVAGGDGTLNELMNGFDLNSNIPIGLIPIGSGNDFAIALNNPVLKPRSYLSSFLSDNVEIRSIDLGQIKVIESGGNTIDKLFINSLGIGFDARVAYLNQTNKILSGSLSYITAIFRALVDFKLLGFSITNIDKTISKQALFCSVGNGETIGGGLYLMPGAKIDDGFLDLSIVDIDSRLELIKLLPKARNNQLKGIQYLDQSRFNELEIKLESPYYIHIDGEIVSSDAKNIQVKVLPKRIQFIQA